MDNKTLESMKEIAEALQAAVEHLDYCGYGDSYERECAREDKLPEKLEAALEMCRQLGLLEK